MILEKNGQIIKLGVHMSEKYQLRNLVPDQKEKAEC
jgi:hypothetical protein